MSGSKNTELTVKYVWRSFCDDQLRVQDDRLGRVLDEPDQREHDAPARRSASGSVRAAPASSRSRAAGRTAARTGRRRRPSAAAPSRSRASRSPGAAYSTIVQRQQPLDPAGARHRARPVRPGSRRHRATQRRHDQRERPGARRPGRAARAGSTSCRRPGSGPGTAARARQQREQRRPARDHQPRAATTTASADHARPTAAYSGWRWTTRSCGECQISPSSSTGASTSAPSIAAARERVRSGASERAGGEQRDDHDADLGQRSASARRPGSRKRIDPLPSARMSSAKLALACGLAALVAVGCGATPSRWPARPADGQPIGRAVDSSITPRTTTSMPAAEQICRSSKVGSYRLQIGAAPAARGSVQPTPGAAQGMQIEGTGRRAPR